MSPCLYHETLPIPIDIVHTMSPGIWIKEIQQQKTSSKILKIFFTEILYSEMPKYKLYENRKTIYRYPGIKITEIQKYKLQKYRN